MTINFQKALGVHADALELRAERTRVLASNIANESTPGFTARDIDFASVLQERVDGEAGVRRALRRGGRLAWPPTSGAVRPGDGAGPATWLGQPRCHPGATRGCGS